MLVLYVAYMLIYAGLWIRRVKPARVRMFLPLAFILPTALQFVFLIGRSSIEYAFPSESSGRITGYLVLDMFWLLILGPTFTLATVLFPLHYVRYVVLVRLLRQQIQRSFDDHHRSVIEKSHHDHSIESPIELEPKEDDSPKMDSSNGLSVHKERLILWLRRLTSNRALSRTTGSPLIILHCHARIGLRTASSSSEIILHCGCIHTELTGCHCRPLHNHTVHRGMAHPSLAAIFSNPAIIIDPASLVNISFRFSVLFSH